MKRHVALLRAVNVGGTGMIRMEDLRKIFTAAGAGDVSTYIQSGNVIFSASTRELPGIQRKVRAKLTARLGAKAAAVFRTAEELHAMVRRDPFSLFAAESDVARYVLFLADEPAVRPAMPFRSEKEMCDVIELSGLHAFVISRPKPSGMYGFPNNWVEKDLAVRATARNWKTVSKLAALTEK